jgi:hypothetical protein
MVEVNTRGKSGGCNFGSFVGYFLYFSILAAVAVVGEFWQLNIMSYLYDRNVQFWGGVIRF